MVDVYDGPFRITHMYKHPSILLSLSFETQSFSHQPLGISYFPRLAISFNAIFIPIPLFDYFKIKILFISQKVFSLCHKQPQMGAEKSRKERAHFESSFKFEIENILLVYYVLQLFYQQIIWSTSIHIENNSNFNANDGHRKENIPSRFTTRIWEGADNGTGWWWFDPHTEELYPITFFLF